VQGQQSIHTIYKQGGERDHRRKITSGDPIFIDSDFLLLQGDKGGGGRGAEGASPFRKIITFDKVSSGFAAVSEKFRGFSCKMQDAEYCNSKKTDALCDEMCARV
jgi:hypothetical protein